MTKPRSDSFTPHQKAKIATMLNNGMKRTEIAAELGVSAPMVYRAFPIDIPLKNKRLLKLRAKVIYLEEALECLLKLNQSLLLELMKNPDSPLGAHSTLVTGLARSQEAISKAKSLDSTQRRKPRKAIASSSLD